MLDLCGALKERRLQSCTLRWVCREVILIRDIEVWKSLQRTSLPSEITWSCLRFVEIACVQSRALSHLMEMHACLLSSRRGAVDLNHRHPIYHCSFQRREAQVQAWQGLGHVVVQADNSDDERLILLLHCRLQRCVIVI